MSEPWVQFEDEHLLVVAKPAGVNTHRADTHAQDGMYEWVQRQRPHDSLSVVHRLDKATSGLLVFGKTAVANQSLTQQFERRQVRKRYELLVGRDAGRPATRHHDAPIAAASRGAPVSRSARTDFERVAVGAHAERWVASPRSGRTHQVRVHAAALGMPILGDLEHGGEPAARVFLHAAALSFEHPVTGRVELTSARPPSFDRVLGGEPAAGAPLAALVALEARMALFDADDTNAYLWIDRHHDGFPDVRVERLHEVAFVVNYDESSDGLPASWLDAWEDAGNVAAVFEQRRPRRGSGGPARRVRGAAGAQFEVTELGCRYLIDLDASTTSTGLFLDQRETRRVLRSLDLRGRTVLNAFAHTGSLSVAAATSGAETLTLDLSRRYLDWARDNFRANDLDPDAHDFIYGDALEWMDRLARKGRAFDVVLVDPPSSSTSGKRGARRWIVERDLHVLVERGARLCGPGGRLFVSTNLRRLPWRGFLDHVERGLAAAGRRGSVKTQTLPLDHRSGPGDPPYLKAAWVHLDVETA
jgi:23S rRNA (cytosine1962-C5)-methyltransferase